MSRTLTLKKHQASCSKVLGELPGESPLRIVPECWQGVHDERDPCELILGTLTLLMR